MKIEVEKLQEEQLEQKGVSSWPIWEKEISRFDWHYDSTEECYLLEGEVVVETEDGGEEGLSCIWDVKKPVKKHYNFR